MTEAVRASRPADHSKPRPADRCVVPTLIGEHPSMQLLRERMDRVALSQLPVLLVGETGTGKELVARLIHDRSASSGELVAVNAAALPESIAEAELFGAARGAFTGVHADRQGLLERADRGTLFLDEAAELSPSMQARLLRALESGKVRRLGEHIERPARCRLVLASQQSGESLVRSGRWRPDFFFRIATVELTLPALRERAEDLALLATHFLGSRGLLPLGDAGHALAEHDWPGNVRELSMAVARAALWSPTGRVGSAEILAQVPHLRREERTEASPGGGELREPMTLRELERRYLETQLVHCRRDVKELARQLDISRAQLYRKLARHRLIPSS